MAHVLKISQDKAASIIQHDFREHKCGENVDENLSNLNEYHIFQNSNAWEQYQTDLKNCKMQKRADVNTLASWIITLPKDIDVGSDEEKKFFDGARTFLQERYPNTYVGDAIHRDEPKSRPHMHYLFIPKVKEIKNEKVRDPATGKLKKTGKKIETGRYKISAKELLTRADLSSFHGDLNDYMKNILGREVGILNDSVKEAGGNLSLSEYRLKMERQDAIKKQQEYERQRSMLDEKEKAAAEEIEKQKAELNQKQVAADREKAVALASQKKNSEHLNALDQKAVELNKKEKELAAKEAEKQAELQKAKVVQEEYQAKIIALEEKEKSLAEERQAAQTLLDRAVTIKKEIEEKQSQIEREKQEISLRSEQLEQEEENARKFLAKEHLKNILQDEEMQNVMTSADVFATAQAVARNRIRSEYHRPKLSDEEVDNRFGYKVKEYVREIGQNLVKENDEKIKVITNIYKAMKDPAGIKLARKQKEYSAWLKETAEDREKAKDDIWGRSKISNAEYRKIIQKKEQEILLIKDQIILKFREIFRNRSEEKRISFMQKQAQEQQQQQQQQQAEKKGVSRERKRDDWSR